VLRAQPQQGHGQADLVVPVGRIAQHRAVLLEDLRDLLRGRCLGQRTSDAHDERVEAIAIPGRHATQRSGGVGDEDDTHVTGGKGLETLLRQRLGHDQCRGAGSDGGLEEAMPVGAFTRQGEEDVARGHEARVHGRATDGSSTGA